MKITRESDYAVRIVYYLSKKDEIVGAKQISEETDITQRFALKILRKLCIAEILQSYKGHAGGYKLKKQPFEISLKDVIEAIEGVIAINSCLDEDIECNGISSCNCAMREAFSVANTALKQELEKQTFDKL